MFSLTLPFSINTAPPCTCHSAKAYSVQREHICFKKSVRKLGHFQIKYSNILALLLFWLFFSTPFTTVVFCFRVNFPFGWFYFVLALFLSVFLSNNVSWILDGESSLRDARCLSLWPVGIDSFDLPFLCMTVIQPFSDLCSQSQAVTVIIQPLVHHPWCCSV